MGGIHLTPNYTDWTEWDTLQSEYDCHRLTIYKNLWMINTIYVNDPKGKIYMTYLQETMWDHSKYQSTSYRDVECRCWRSQLIDGPDERSTWQLCRRGFKIKWNLSICTRVLTAHPKTLTVTLHWKPDIFWLGQDFTYFAPRRNLRWRRNEDNVPHVRHSWSQNNRLHYIDNANDKNK